MKSFIAPAYTFTPGVSGVGTVNLSGISGFNKKFLVSIINQTRGIIIYSTASDTLKYTNVTGTTVTLFADTSAMSSSDVLQVIYEVESAESSTIVSPAASVQIGYTDGSLNFTPVTDSSPFPINISTSSLASPLSVSDTTAQTSLASIDGKLTSPLAVTGTFYQATQPVSAVSLPLPAGAATSTKQDTGNASLASIDSKLTNPLPVSGTFYQATQPVSATALPLPSGASTSAKQDIGNTSLGSIDSKVISMADVQTLGSISGSSVFLTNVTNFNTLAFAVSGSWVGTIVLELSIDATTWYSTSYTALTSGNTATSFTANTAGQVNTVGFNYFRLRGATIASGTAQIAYVSSLAVSNVMLDNPLPAGSNNIGSINNVTGTVSLPTNAATETTLSAINTKTPLGAATISGSRPVNIASDQIVPTTVVGSLNSDALLLEAVNILKQIANPISMEPASGRMRVVLDPLGGAQTLATVTTVTTLGTLTSMSNIGGIPANSTVYDTMSMAWASSIRGRIT